MSRELEMELVRAGEHIAGNVFTREALQVMVNEFNRAQEPKPVAYGFRSDLPVEMQGEVRALAYEDDCVYAKVRLFDSDQGMIAQDIGILTRSGEVVQRVRGSTSLEPRYTKTPLGEARPVHSFVRPYELAMAAHVDPKDVERKGRRFRIIHRLSFTEGALTQEKVRNSSVTVGQVDVLSVGSVASIDNGPTAEELIEELLDAMMVVHAAYGALYADAEKLHMTPATQAVSAARRSVGEYRRMCLATKGDGGQ